MGINTEEFMQTTTEAALDDRIDPCPAGDYNAIIDSIEIRDFTYKSGDREGQTGYRMVVRYDVQDDAVKQSLGRDKVTVQQSVLLDLNETNDGLDMGKGKNVQLGAIRTALGQNVEGQPWSPAMLQGQLIHINVKAGVYNDRVTAEVNSVSAPV